MSNTKVTNMRSSFCADRKIKISSQLPKNGMGIAITYSGVINFTLVANYQEDLDAYEQAHADN